MAVPIISIFFVSCGIVVAFNGLNTYCAGKTTFLVLKFVTIELLIILETLPEQRSAVISGKYVVQYSLGAVSTGAVVPMIDAMGVGLVFTICEMIFSPLPSFCCDGVDGTDIDIGTIVSFIGGIAVFLVARYGLQMQKYSFSWRT